MAKKQYTDKFQGGVDGFHGFDDFDEMLKAYMEVADNVMDEEEKIAQQFVSDLKKLPSPISQVRKAGYTHMIDSFAYKRKETEIEVGWGKYYGPMVENGTKFMTSRPHLKPLWNSNQEKYIKDFMDRNNLS